MLNPLHRPSRDQVFGARHGAYGLLVFRAGLGALVLLMLSIEGAAGPLRLHPWWPLWPVLITAFINLIFYALTRRGPARRRGGRGQIERALKAPAPGEDLGEGKQSSRPRALLAAQVAVDLGLVIALVYLTGGVNSVFVFLPFACVLTAAVVLGGYASLLYASVATVLLAAVSTAYSLAYVGLLRLPWVTSSWVITFRPSLSRTLATVVGQGVALHVVAFLGGNLAARLRRETRLKEEILAAIGEGLIVADANRRVVYVNAEALDLLGFQSPDQLIGRPWEDVFRRRGDAQVRRMLNPGVAFPGTAGEERGPASDSQRPVPPRSRVIEFSHRKRGKLYLSVKTSPFRRRHGALGGVVAIFHDITAQRVMEAVQERADRLQEISLVAAGIAHELRNPLASIRGCVQELARLETSHPQSRRLSEIVCAETDHLDKIVTDFLDFARMRPPRPVPCDIHSLIEEVLVLLQTGCRLDAIEIETDVPGALRVVADRDQLKQVLLNLARNAVEAMPEGGRLSVCAVPVPRLPGGESGRSDAGAIRIDVTDTGCGIAPEHIDKLFTPFFTTRPNGTGMGLSIVERIVRAHSGHLEVESQRGAGSTFRLWIPAVPPARPLQAPSFWDSVDTQEALVADQPSEVTGA